MYCLDQPEMTGDRYTQATKSTGNDESTLALKPRGRFIQSPKQRVPVAPQNGPRSNKNFLFFKCISLTGDELRQKCETERNEIDRLHQEIAELQQIRDDLYEEDDSSASSDDDSQDEEELQSILNQLIKENQELVVSSD